MLLEKSLSSLAIGAGEKSIERDLSTEASMIFKDQLVCLSLYNENDERRRAARTATRSTEAGDTTSVLTVVENQPEYEGGYAAMLNFIKKNLRNRDGDDGTVYVQFVVGRDGTVGEAKVIRSLSPNADAEAIRIVNLMPKWKPGTQNGKPVLVRFVLPIRFK